MKILVVGMAEMSRCRRYAVTSTWAVEQTRKALLRSAGTAVALGHQTVPFAASGLDWLATVRRDLLEAAPRPVVTRLMAEL